MAMVRITRAIFGNESSILTVSAMLHGEYGQREVYAGVPCVVGREGVLRVLTLMLEPKEQEKLAASCAVLQKSYQQLQL